MLKTFRCKETENIFNRRLSRRFPPDIQNVALRKLVYLNAARSIKDLLILPGNKLESLKGSRKGQYSIRINDQWRICFEWRSGDAFDVEITDYH
jgi:toxin HigB-1